MRANTIKTGVMRLLLILVCAFGLSCKQEDPTPELSDKIFKDLQSELEIAKKNTEFEVSQQSKMSVELKQAVPQTGQRKFAEKRVFESASQLTVYRQQEKYFEVKLEERRIYVRKRYLESLLPNGRLWPSPEEAAEYALRLKLRRAKLEWDKRNVPRGTASDQKAKKNQKSE